MKAASAEEPRQLLLPTYQHRLRSIGRQLDLGGYGAVNLLEVPGGFLVRALRPGERVPEVLEYPEGEVPDLLAHAIAARGEGERRHRLHPLLPTGYEDFLRALGYDFDKQRAEAVMVAELEGFVVVTGMAKVERYERTDIAPFQRLLRGEDLAALLDGDFRRRAAETKRWGLFSRPPE